ncbi:DEAD/DEAH box helicase [Saccharopolyspora spinosa]|uniref:Helicase n=1 Tax=Saccharopolyspora spinosa TaxID=60894 RepID=A0A2N3XUC9_SACSN|nr:type ISP restriction/modification enzyme [Saccharopolyspora spinosa]PKW14287.1 putative helicase [Saccharopolyspora spinosa]
MPTTITDLLDDLRATSLDERDKGDKFERLIAAYMRTDPEWQKRFSDVWLWSEWPGRNGRPDTGIDLVARNRDTGDYAAIQCKCYDSDATIAKGDIDSFVTTSSKAEFSLRYLVDTARDWSKNAKDALDGLSVPVQRIDIRYLDDANIDWSQFSWSTPEVVVSTGKKSLRPHQQKALDAVRDGFAERDRGKLVMACGTGKTYTSLKIAEDQVGAGGSVLFLVPSIQLLSQTLREWMANSEVDIRPFAVCSDVRVGRKTVDDDSGMSTIDLTEPATTDAATLAARMRSAPNVDGRMTVVFATYQSIDVVAQAQQLDVPAFDLVICDEAHRTTGVTLAGQDESAFVRVHDGEFLKARRRLYMTATPRVFGDDARRKADDANAALADMDKEALFGPELHRLGFGEAVEERLLTDYKVVVLAVDEQYVSENFQNALAQSGEIKLDEAARLIGCWNGLAKHFGTDEQVTDRTPMRTAVAFARDINASQRAAEGFPILVDRVLEDENPDDESRNPLRVEAQHVDGTMRIHTRNDKLAWLKQEPESNVCRILTNARCLSEGVDVPSLDAVLFLTPRSSQVDVVQSVGRVMRKAPGKELGYIILPIVVPSGVAPEEALRDNERYRVVWQVLQALRSHDDRFNAMINSIELNKSKPDKLIIDDGTPRGENEADQGDQQGQQGQQLTFDFDFDAFRDAMFARIVQKVGERKYWETWAKDIAEIAQTHITRINGLLRDKTSPQAQEFEEFVAGLRGNLNDSITADQAVEMLSQHLITRPVFEALFTGYDFAANNPVAHSMERMIATLDQAGLAAENETMEGFYKDVRRRVEGVTEAEGKQRVIVELYERFFAAAFRKTVDKLGIVYTPVEIVDFILRSADEVLQAEFGQGLTDEGVHILDGFTGTGTFMVRLLQSGLIKPYDLARKYAEELHANEILLLAYYIAAVNMETTYAELTGDPQGFPGLILTDTFQSWEDDDTLDLDVFPENNARLERLKQLPITVIVGNPPYSSGQDSANDDNANESYTSLDEQIRTTYADRSTATNKNSLYDSYIRAIKWATLRIKQRAGRGVIAYITNGGWLDSNTADGMRKTLTDEFSSIHVYNLRGNQRTAGEQSRKEGGKIFGGGSRATVAVTVLVKNPDKIGQATIHYTDIGDYLTREQKLAKVADAGSLTGLDTYTIIPNQHGDWLNQRRDDFVTFIGIDEIFDVYSGGLKTNRDVWCYSSSVALLEKNMRKLIATYESDRHEGRSSGNATWDESLISWNRSLLADLDKGRERRFRKSAIRPAMYRPFVKQRAYFDRPLNDMVYRLERLHPSPETGNWAIYFPNPGSMAPPFMSLMVAELIDNGATGSSGANEFARWRYEPIAPEAGTLALAVEDSDAEVIDGYRKVDNITDQTLKKFRVAYGNQQITKDDIFFYVYGLLHSSEYREAYAADLKKSLPRIPFVRGFVGYAEAGRKLSELHVGYESVDPYPLDGLDVEPTGDPYEFFAVDSKRMKWGKPTPEQKAAGEKQDKSTLHYNDRITLRGIPDEANRYMLGSRSAVEWIIDRYYIKTDKASGIVNDPNDWSREVSNPRYILDLVARVVMVSVETMKIVDALPPLEVIEPGATKA